VITAALLPALDEWSAPFWEGCSGGELRVQRCGGCGAFRMPPRPMCPRCRSLDARWEPVSGRGRIWSFVVPHPPLLPAFNDLAPYNVIVVAIDEDPTIRFVGNLVASADGAVNEVDPAGIEIDVPVRVVFSSPVSDEAGAVSFPRWVLA